MKDHLKAAAAKLELNEYLLYVLRSLTPIYMNLINQILMGNVYKIKPHEPEFLSTIAQTGNLLVPLHSHPR